LLESFREPTHVKLTIAWIGKTKNPAIQSLTDEYLQRLRQYAEAEGTALKDEAALLKLCGHEGKSTRRRLVLLDSRGKQFSSEELAGFLLEQQDHNPAPMVFAIGPADGFSDDLRRKADLVLSMGRMTLAHELARVVLLEQVYRAFTILKGHPYHLGH
jgi:23S rRNA (pseudouridine1915-N3)-methyltransferase